MKIAQPTTKEVFVDERIVDQLREHEDAFAGIFSERFIGAFDGILYAEAKPKVTWDDVVDRAEIEGHGSRGRAFMQAGQSFDRGAELRLVEGIGGRVLGVDRGVALLGWAKLVDEIIFAEVKIGDFDEMGCELVEQDCERRSERAGLGGEIVERFEINLAVDRRATDLSEEHAIATAAGIRREVFCRHGMGEKRRLEPGRGHCEIGASERESGLRAQLAHGELVARVEREDGDERWGRRDHSSPSFSDSGSSLNGSPTNSTPNLSSASRAANTPAITVVRLAALSSK